MRYDLIANFLCLNGVGFTIKMRYKFRLDSDQSFLFFIKFVEITFISDQKKLKL